MKSHGVWLTDSDRSDGIGPCAAWITEPSRPSSSASALVLPPITYEWSSGYHLWRTIAESLAERGIRTLRLDYWGTGDSDGYASQVLSMEPWRSSVRRAAEYLRARGPQNLLVIGAQVGSALAYLEAEAIDPMGITAIAPVGSGRRLVRAMSVLGMRAPEHVGGLSVGGYYLPATLVDELSAHAAPAPTQIPVLAIEASKVAACLQRTAEEAEVPLDVVGEITEWACALVQDTPGTSPADTARGATGSVRAQDSVVLHEPDGDIVERFVTLSEEGFVGVLTAPAGGSDPADGIYVLLNSGSDPHTGPGRAWVEIARHLAHQGISTLRVDWRGWGESPSGPTGPGRPYDEHTFEESAAIVRALRAEGFADVVLGGLCSGSSVALEACLTSGASGVVILDLQLYWEHGSLWEPLITQTRQRRLPEIAQIKAEALTGRWDREDAAGARTYGGQLLDDLVAAGARVSLVFSEGDDGIEYLRDRLARRVADVTGSGLVRIVEVPDIDHGMQRTWLRKTIFEVIAAEVRYALGAPVAAR